MSEVRSSDQRTQLQRDAERLEGFIRNLHCAWTNDDERTMGDLLRQWESSAPETSDDAIDRAARLLRILRDDYGKNGEKYRLIIAWLNHYERPIVETSREVACGNPVMINKDWYGPCTKPDGHEGECDRSPQKAPDEHQ